MRGPPTRSPPMRKCKRKNCKEKHHGRGLCKKHWGQVYVKENKDKIHARYLARREKNLEKFKTYYRENKEEIKEYRAKNKQKLKKYQKEYSKRNPDKYLQLRRTPEAKFKATINRANDRKLMFTLTFDEYTSLTSQPCVYCWGSLPETGGGLDRIDNSLGYTIDNVLPCCTACNRIRGDYLTVTEMKGLTSTLYDTRGAAIGQLWKKVT